MRALLLVLLLPLTLPAQSTKPDIEGLLIHKQIYLRGLWSEGKLQFDPAGQLQGKSSSTSFTLAGADISSVDLKPDHLQLKGKRYGILFDTSGTHFVTFDKIDIRVAAPPDGDYQAALTAIFSDLPGMIPSLPDIWQTYAGQHFAHGASNSAADDPPKGTHPPFNSTGMKAPEVTFAPEPGFTPAAKEKRVSGNVLVYLEVDTSGSPRHIRILRPLGMGLDEQSALAVSRYKFKPATKNGTPVAVEMNVEVNFQIF